MGHIEPPHVETLVRRTAPEVARRLRQEQIDAVLLSTRAGVGRRVLL